MKFASLLLLTTLVYSTYVSGIPYENCAPDGLGTLTDVEVSGCKDGDTRCVLPRGKNAAINIKFTAKKRALKVTATVHGILANIPVPFPLENPDACNGCGLTCPLQVGNHTYSYKLPVQKTYPRVSLTVKWELLNEFNKPIVCVKIPARVR